MLTKKQNFLETVRRGKPDRYVNQYEALELMFATPYAASNPRPVPGGPPVVNAWGVTSSFPAGMPGPFPIHDEEHIVLKDIENWRDYVKAPNVIYPEEAWAPFVEMVSKVDRNEKMIAPFVAPGLFEQCHYLMEIQNCLMAFYEYPDEMHELIDYITEWEVTYAKEICKYLKPDALFHHDDWGSGASSFLSPEMFEEFFVPGYKKIYDTYREGGVEVIIHHSDSYAANLVPSMIKMGIDVWQGVMTSNNLAELIEKYGDKITFMGGIDSATIDHVDWSREQIASEVERAAREYGRKAFIPCNTMGDPGCLYEGVNVTLTDEIEKLNRKIMAEGGF